MDSKSKTQDNQDQTSQVYDKDSAKQQPVTQQQTKAFEKNDVSAIVLIVVNVLYAIISSSLTFINKSLYLNFGFNSPLILLLLQCLGNVVICSAMILYNKFNPRTFAGFAKVDMKIGLLSEILPKWRKGFILGLCNLINVDFGIYSIKYVSIPLFVTLRRCTIITTFFCAYLFQGKIPTQREYFKMCLVILGALIAGIDTFNRDWIGYFLIFLNNISQSATNVLMSKFNKNREVNSFEVNFFYALLGLPVLSIYTTYTGEINQLIDVFYIEDETRKYQMKTLLTLSGISGIGITLSSILVVNLCSPYMMNVVGNLKNAIATVIGFIIFNDQNPTFNVVSGITIGFIGSSIHAYDEITRNRQENKEYQDSKKNK